MSSSYGSIHKGTRDILKSLGIVFGDIGTSPIYTFAAIFAMIPVSPENVMGACSLIIWTLILMVSVQYAWLAMSLEKEGQGEGGIIILKEILTQHLSSHRVTAIVGFLAFLGTAFFMGDGVVTPAISILSAVEGLKYIPYLTWLNQHIVMAVAMVITIILFAVQKRGTDRISLAFGPIMLLWFGYLTLSGILAIKQFPTILLAFYPSYAIFFLKHHGFMGFLLLSKIILSATGSETLYTDMGHLGRKPIVQAWFFVFPTLCLIYLGQGVFILHHPEIKNIFYGMMLHQFAPLYIPLLVLSIMATVIASQAMISGLFSIVYQGITTQIMPRLHIDYTSRDIMTQIYIPSVNAFLLIFVLLTIGIFKSSANLTDAYGIAVSGTMLITSIFLSCIFFFKRKFIKAIAAFVLIFINMLYFTSNLFKIPTGGYWSLMLACMPLFLMVIYSLGQRRLRKAMKQVPLAHFVERYMISSPKIAHIKGTALFLSKARDPIPAYIANTMFTNNIIYEDNIIVKVNTQKTAFGLTCLFDKELAPGLRVFEIKAGYMEVVNIQKILHSADIHPKVIFYGIEDFRSDNIFWKIYIIIKKLTTSFVQFYKFPINKLHGVAVQVDL
jgi:KUP system potassium uptake protein